MGGGGISGGCGAERRDGDDVSRDERDAKSSKCRERTRRSRGTEGVHKEQGGREVKRG